VYYVAPPDGLANLTSAYWTGYYKTRNPRAEMEYAAWMQAQDPRAKAQALAELDQATAQVMDSMRQEKADAAAYAVKASSDAADVYKAELQFIGGIREANAAASARELEARLKFETETAEQGTIDPTTAAKYEGLKNMTASKARELAEATATGDKALTDAKEREYYGLYKSTLKAGQSAGLNRGQVATLDGELGRDLRALVPASERLDAFMVSNTTQAKAAGVALGYVPPTAPGGRAGASERLPGGRPPPGEGVSVSGSTSAAGTPGTGGVVPAPDAAGGAGGPSIPWQQQLDALAARKAEIDAQFANPYTNPYAKGNYTRETGYGVLGEGAPGERRPPRPTADQMKTSVAETLRARRAAPGTAAAADSTTPAQAEEARAAAAAASQAKTATARVALDLDQEMGGETVLTASPDRMSSSRRMAAELARRRVGERLLNEEAPAPLTAAEIARMRAEGTHVE
jgi:hypothetical protein